MGPLSGYTIIEIVGLGPGPFSGMMFADMGAEVISIHRVSAFASEEQSAINISERGKRSIALNLKCKKGVETVLKLIESADAIFEGFRPGVMERFGLGPEVCLERNPKLVYGRMTGWGQDGPLSSTAGHDINYISLSGALHAIGRKGEKPHAPLNLVGDFGGGGMFLAYGMVCAMLSVHKTGKGQVVDVSMVEGSAALMHMLYAFNAMGVWSEDRGNNFLDGGAHFYDTYETKDGKYISVGALEPQFYALLLEKAELDPEFFGMQLNQPQWNQMSEKMAEVFLQKTRDEWCAIFEGSDACVAPVLSMAEVAQHKHNKARKSFYENYGVLQAAPAPKFSETKPEIPRPPQPAGSDTQGVLKDHGFTDGEIEKLKNLGILT